MNKNSQDKFDEMDELALSLQKQIKDLDNIPELDDKPEDTLADDIYTNSTDQNHFADSEDLKYQLEKQLSEQSKTRSSFPGLHYLIPIIIGLFFIISLTSYWLISNNENNEEQITNTQNLPLELPNKQDSLLTDDADIVEAKIENESSELVAKGKTVLTTDNQLQASQNTTGQPVKASITESSEHIDHRKTVKKIPLVYIDEQNSKPVSTENQLPEAANSQVGSNTIIKPPISTEVELINPTINKPVQVEFEHVNKAKAIDNKNDIAKKEVSIPAPVISQINPSPVIGNNERQWISINGKHFSKETIVSLQWPLKPEKQGRKQSKSYSINKNSSQLKFVNSNLLKLHINTGTTAQTWQITLYNKDKNSQNYQFEVVKPFTPTKKQENLQKQTTVKKQTTVEHYTNTDKKADKSSSNKHLNYINNQVDSNFTLQLFGTSNYQAINKVANAHKNLKSLFWYQTKRSNKDWYTLSYGSFTSKEKALKAFDKLPKTLRTVKPWARSYESLKAQFKKQLDGKQPVSVQKPKSQKPLTKSKNSNALLTMRSTINNTSPDNWVFQLISLSDEKSMKAYIQRHKLDNKAKYFKRRVNGQDRYTLIYGVYQTKNQATAALKNLPFIIRQGKPWIKQYRDIQKLMQ